MYLLVNIFIISIIILYINIYKPISKLIYYLMYFSLLTSLTYLLFNWHKDYHLFNNMIYLSKNNILFSIIILITNVFMLPIIIINQRYLYSQSYSPDMYSVILLSLIGGLLMITCENFIILFLGLEIISICFYILICVDNKNKKYIISSIKYFILGSIMVCFLLLGISFVYGATGVFSMNKSLHIINHDMYLIGLLLILITLLFKLGIFPFNNWMIDIYYNSPSIITLYMSTIGKIVFISCFNKLIILLKYNNHIINMIHILLIPTLIISNIKALKENDLKKMLLYSSISHTAYIINILLINNIYIYKMLFIYIISYILSFTVFFSIIITINNHYNSYNIKYLHGLFINNKFLSIILSISSIYLAGLPISGIFFGKLYVIQNIIYNKNIYLLMSILVSSIFSIIYYIKIIFHIMLFKKTYRDNILYINHFYKIILLFLIIVMIFLGVFPFVIYNIVP
ncbi:MAG: hypothetical protein IR527_01705 [Bacteroides sp.]|nr:MAG: hypothetical protein IR527_01705 [Bacteroides sp.]